MKNAEGIKSQIPGTMILPDLLYWGLQWCDPPFLFGSLCCREVVNIELAEIKGYFTATDNKINSNELMQKKIDIQVLQ